MRFRSCDSCSLRLFGVVFRDLFFCCESLVIVGDSFRCVSVVSFVIRW